MQRNSFSLFYFLFLLMVSSGVRAENQIYSNSQLGVELTFPSVFSVHETPGHQSKLLTIGSVDQSIVYLVKIGNNNKDLPDTKKEDFLNRVQKLYVGVTTPEESIPIEFDNVKGRQIKFLGQNGEDKVYKVLRLLVKDKTWYALQIYSQKDYPEDDIINKFFNSFKFIGS